MAVKKGGRNKQRDTGEERAGFLIYLLPDEKEAMSQAAQKEGLDLSVFIRHAALLKARERP